MTGTWNDIATARPAPGAEPQEKVDPILQLCADVLSRGKGKELLRLLRARTKDHVHGPAQSESALSWYEGQRYLVHQLETWTAKGLKVALDEFRNSLAEHRTPGSDRAGADRAGRR